MFTKMVTVVLCFALVFPVAAFAQTAPDSTGKVVVKENTEVKLKLAEGLTSKTAKVGDPVNLLLVSDLKVGDSVVAKAGSKARGTVTTAKKSGRMGKAGKLNMQLEFLTLADGTNLSLRAVQGKEGDSKLGTTVVLTVAIGGLGLLKKGKQAEIAADTPVTAYVVRDTGVVPLK